MKNNKYLIFAAIGFELVTLILIAIWGGDYLVKQGFSKVAPAFCVLGAFLLWFISLIVKLKNMKND